MNFKSNYSFIFFVTIHYLKITFPDFIFFPDTVFTNSDSTEYYVIDGDNLTNQDLNTLQTSEYNADSSLIFTVDHYVDYLDSIITSPSWSTFTKYTPFSSPVKSAGTGG